MQLFSMRHRDHFILPPLHVQMSDMKLDLSVDLDFTFGYSMLYPCPFILYFPAWKLCTVPGST